jgi:uncharacterized RDD family membrane protein YckC
MFAHHECCSDMPTTKEFWKVAAQVASERGGLVVGFAKDSEQPELGSALDNVLGYAAEGRVRVTSLSDWADWIEQVEAFYRLKPDWGRGKRGTADANYYRVKFEAGNLESAKFGTRLDELDSPLRSTSNAGFGTSAAYSTMMTSFGGSAAPLSGFQGVTFLPRLAARLIDVLVHYFAAVVAGFLFALILAIAAGGQPPAWVLHRVFQTHFAGFAAGILGLFAYNVICTSIHGSTPGKLLLRMQVIQDDGSPCRPKSAIIRELGYFIDILFFGLVGYFAMREDPEQQRLGDEWGDTIVCKQAQVPSTSQRSGTQFALGLSLGIAVDIALLMTGWLIQMNT